MIYNNRNNNNTEETAGMKFVDMEGNDNDDEDIHSTQSVILQAFWGLPDDTQHALFAKIQQGMAALNTADTSLPAKPPTLTEGATTVGGRVSESDQALIMVIRNTKGASPDEIVEGLLQQPFLLRAEFGSMLLV